ncbi:uncharacterized protein LOC112271685 [Brachypodium distachyon]|uniref:uncharacterized protein LOC112271685 n=1 Tax=Brachypodium distachyon TaxID=15368 RepID=UPI000D0DEBBD|nr:uncharacterized protein LOC112271685 [Brachypodium distachyon]|eukprot:XP_024317207.1 uncharacterized protein LOC112271685 [Brachypodium distachyon]
MAMNLCGKGDKTKDGPKARKDLEFFNQKCLDNNMLRLSCVYFTRESFRLKEPHVAIADPLLFSKATIGLEEWKRGLREKAISYLAKFFAMHKQRRYVLTLYHLDEHSVVVAFSFKEALATYLDPLRQKKGHEPRDFKAVGTLFEEAWKKAVTDYELPSYGRKKITYHRNFACIQQPQGTVFCGYYYAYIIRNWVTNFKPKMKTTYQQMVDYFKTESEYGNKVPAVLVFDIQRVIATILNKEVLKENGDFYEGGVVPMY